MVDSEDWLAIYDERIDQTIDGDTIKTEEDLKSALQNYFENSKKPRVYFGKDGSLNADYNHGARLRPYLSEIARRIFKERGNRFLGIRPTQSYTGSLVSKNFSYKFKYNIKTHSYKFYENNRLIKRLPKQFFTQRFTA